MGKKKGKGPKQSSPVAGSSKDQYGPDKQPDGSDSGDADSAVCSEDSMHRGIDLSDTQPHNDDDSSVCSEASMPRGIYFSNTQQHKKCTVVLPELRVMMLGKTGTGKSASGNTILGREAFKSEASALPVTKSCDSQSGVVEGRNITVIDTPAITTRKAAWLSERVDPGPHVFLLVIPLGRFIEEDGKEVKWIQNNFGEEALKFTIILFTGGDRLKGKPFENFLQESPKLQSVLDRVEGRYHVFDNSLPEERYQVKGLIKKIENVLISKLGYVYTHEEQEKVKTAVRQEGEREREKAERTRKQEEMNMRDNQARNAGISWRLQIFLSVLMFLTFHCCYRPEDPVVLPEMRVMMLGKTGTGKSASGNTILGREAFKSEASALLMTKSCDSQSVVVEGRNITVIYVPAITTRKAAWLLRNNMGYSYSDGLYEQVKTAVRKKEEMKRSEEERKRRENEEERKRREEERERREEERERREEERERREEERREEESKRRNNEEERKIREEERREEESKRRNNENDRKRREEKREIREEERERGEEEREIREEEREIREEERERGEERKERGEERKERGEERREIREEERERTTEQSWNWRNILNGFIGFVLPDILWKC